MKHLKHFESHNLDDEFRNTLNLFCEENLINLIDDGFKLDFDFNTHYVNIDITHNTTFKWNNIKDSFIPFLTIFNDEYNISPAIEFVLYDYDSIIDYPDDDVEMINFYINKDKIILDAVDNINYDEFYKSYNNYPFNEYDIFYISINLTLPFLKIQ